MLHLLPRIFLSVLDPHSCAPPSQQYAGAVNILESRAAGVGWSLEREQRTRSRNMSTSVGEVGVLGVAGAPRVPGPCMCPRRQVPL